MALQPCTCKACGHRSKLDFNVPDEIWECVVPEALRTRVICLACFDTFAAERGVSYAAQLVDLYFAGDRAAFRFIPDWSVDVTDD